LTDSRPIRALWVLLLSCGAGLAQASDVSVVGVFPSRGAVLIVDNAGPQSVLIGHRLGAVTLISVDKTGAVIEESGRRRTVALGPHVTGTPGPSRAAQVTLMADPSGHFVSEGSINGASIRFLVDTGATVVAIPGKDAREIGLNFSRAERGIAMTANGPVRTYYIKLDSVKLGGIELLNVDGMVIDGGGLTQPLLGMSFLNRLEMRREGDSMTLRRRF